MYYAIVIVLVLVLLVVAHRHTKSRRYGGIFGAGIPSAGIPSAGIPSAGIPSAGIIISIPVNGEARARAYEARAHKAPCPSVSAPRAESLFTGQLYQWRDREMSTLSGFNGSSDGVGGAFIADGPNRDYELGKARGYIFSDPESTNGGVTGELGSRYEDPFMEASDAGVPAEYRVTGPAIYREMPGEDHYGCGGPAIYNKNRPAPMWVPDHDPLEGPERDCDPDECE